MYLMTSFLRLIFSSSLVFFMAFSWSKGISIRAIHHYHGILADKLLIQECFTSSPLSNYLQLNQFTHRIATTEQKCISPFLSIKENQPAVRGMNFGSSAIILSLISSIIPLGQWSYSMSSLEWYWWQFFLLGSLLILIISIYKILRFVLNKFLRWLAIKISYERIEKLANPLCIILVYITFQSIVPFLHLPSFIIDETLMYGNILLCFFCIFSVYQGIDLLSFYIVEKQKVGKKFQFNLMLLPVISVSLKVCVSVIGAIKILQILEFDIKGLLTGVGIGGLGFALASQDTIKNFFGSVVILTDKPFNIGDYITAERIDGRVEEIGFRSTRVRTPQGYIIYAPNGKLADTYITNYGEKQYKGLDTILAISSSTPIAAIKIFVEGLRKIVERCPIARAGKHAVYLYELRDSILYIQLKVDFNITEERIELINRQEILIHIIRLARTLGIRFAFPSHTVQIEPYEHQEAEEPDSETEQNYFKRKLQDFLNQPVG